jgi:hypothetical protein
MSNNVGTPLFYVGISMFSLAILYGIVVLTTTDDYGQLKPPNKVMTDFIDDMTNGRGGNGSTKHNKHVYRKRKSKRKRIKK